MAITVRWAMDCVGKLVLLALVSASLCIQASYAQTKDETTQQTNEKIRSLATQGQVRAADISIGSGDVVHIEVFDVPELSRDVRVSTTGEISVPLVHERIRAAGLSSFELEQRIEELLIENGLVSHPQVSVFVKEQNSQPVTIIGAVYHAMTYQVIRPTTLLELLADAGGITDNAGTVVLITRQTQKESVKPVSESSGGDSSDSGTQTIRIQLQDLLSAENIAFNIPIYGGDIVNVPPAGIVYVMGGGVSQPGGYVVQSHGEQISVLKAVALAHGLGGYAKPDDALLYRTNPATGEREATPVHIKQIENNKSEDVAMKSNDILYVPDSLAKKIAVKAAEAAVSIGTGVLIYRSSTGH